MSASASVWAMVSGLPSGIRLARTLMMLQAFVDDSKSDRKLLVLAGYIASADAWTKFSDEWDDELKSAPVWNQFKMSTVMYRGKDPEYAKLRRLFEIIKKYVTADICVVVPLDVFTEACDIFGFIKSNDRNPYFLAWNLMISTYVKIFSNLDIYGDIEFCFDEQSEKIHIVSAWEQFKKSMPPKKRKLVNNMPSFKNDDIIKPLQAADFLAWWKRKDVLKTGNVFNQAAIFPWDHDPSYCTHIYATIDKDGIIELGKRAQIANKYNFSISYRHPYGKWIRF